MTDDNARMGHLTIERWQASDINPAAYNPRVRLQPGDPEYAKLKRSIEELTYVDPLVVNRRTGNLVGGHQRFFVMVDEFGVDEFDVSVVDVDPLTEKTMNLALNKIKGRDDEDQLRKILAELEASPDADATLAGFDLEEVNAWLAGLDDELGDPLGLGDEGGDGDGDGGEDGDGAEQNQANVGVSIGGYRFTVDREVYANWLEDIRQDKGFDDTSIINEMRRRLKL